MADARRLYRAENQNISVLENVTDHKFAVKGTQGVTYLVDLDDPSCECPDWQKRSPEDGCKHILKVKIESGIVEPPNGGKTNKTAQNYTQYDPIEGRHDTHPAREASTTTSDSSSQEQSETPGSAREKMSTQNPPDTEGTSYVWTEREQIDDDVVCDNCSHINDNSLLKCEDCGELLFDDEDAVDPDEALSEQVGTHQYTSEEEVHEAYEAKVDNIVIGTYEHIKGGIKILNQICVRVTIFFGLVYIGMWLARGMGFSGLPGVIGGGIAGIVFFGYLFRHPNTPMSEMA